MEKLKTLLEEWRECYKFNSYRSNLKEFCESCNCYRAQKESYYECCKRSLCCGCCSCYRSQKNQTTGAQEEQSVSILDPQNNNKQELQVNSAIQPSPSKKELDSIQQQHKESSKREDELDFDESAVELPSSSSKDKLESTQVKVKEQINASDVSAQPQDKASRERQATQNSDETVQRTQIEMQHQQEIKSKVVHKVVNLYAIATCTVCTA